MHRPVIEQLDGQRRDRHDRKRAKNDEQQQFRAQASDETTAGTKKSIISPTNHSAPRRNANRLMRRVASRSRANAIPTIPAGTGSASKCTTPVAVHHVAEISAICMSRLWRRPRLAANSIVRAPITGAGLGIVDMTDHPALASDV